MWKILKEKYICQKGRGKCSSFYICLFIYFPRTQHSPLDYQTIAYNTDLKQNIKKKESTPHELKAAAIESINILYPETEWLHNFTDGSLLKWEAVAVARIHYKLFNLYLSVGINSAHFDGEIATIDTALTQLLHRIN